MAPPFLAAVFERGCLSHRDKHPRFFASGFAHTPFSPESTLLQHQRFKTPAKGSDFNEWPRYTPWRAHEKRWYARCDNVCYSARTPKSDPLTGVSHRTTSTGGSLAPKSGRLAQHNALKAHIRVYERPNASCTAEPFAPQNAIALKNPRRLHPDAQPSHPSFAQRRERPSGFGRRRSPRTHPCP